MKRPLTPEEQLPYTTYSPLHHQSVRSAPGFTTHRTVDIFTALLVLLLNPLLQEVDAELEAEVLLLQVIQVLRQSTVTVRHDRQRAPTPLDMSVFIGQK